jgi:SAM-dependent methyltransferase
MALRIYGIYDKLRRYLFMLLNAKSGAEFKRAEYFASFIANVDFDSLLDIGCGKGLVFEEIRDPNESKLLVGVDLIRNRSKKYHHISASATRLPFTQTTFSLVTAFSLIEHILEKHRGKLYKDVGRVIKKKGTFLIQLPNRYALIESHTYLPLFGFLPSRTHSFAYRGDYVSVPSLKAVIRSLKENGFNVYGVEKYGAPFLPFGHFLGKIGLFRLFPMGYIIRAHAEN